MRFLLIVLVLLASLPAIAQDKKKDRRRDGDLKAGSVAPDFTVKHADGKKTVKLSDLKGKPVVLIFGSCT